MFAISSLNINNDNFMLQLNIWTINGWKFQLKIVIICRRPTAKIFGTNYRLFLTRKSMMARDEIKVRNSRRIKVSYDQMRLIKYLSNLCPIVKKLLSALIINSGGKLHYTEKYFTFLVVILQRHESMWMIHWQILHVNICIYL